MIEEVKGHVFILIIVLFSINSNAQTWTSKQFASANTAKDIKFLTEEEKNAIMYINLARLYPKLFVKYELSDNNESTENNNYITDNDYKKSLVKDLNTMEPAIALLFDKDVYESAKCFAIESGIAGIVSHKRINCKRYGHSECCSYGLSSGKEIALQWLVDDGISSLGHRKICLDKESYNIGLNIQPHKSYGVCAVADFK